MTTDLEDESHIDPHESLIQDLVHDHHRRIRGGREEVLVLLIGIGIGIVREGIESMRKGDELTDGLDALYSLLGWVPTKTSASLHIAICPDCNAYSYDTHSHPSHPIP